MTFLLAIAIGPVQDFIAAARKTRDLYMGSHLLSEVSRQVAKSLPAGSTLIFPNADIVKDPDAAVANKIIAIVTGDDMASIVDIAQKKANQILQEYYKETKNQLARFSLGDCINEQLCERQLEQFLEFYAAWWPIDKRYTYEVAYAKVNLLLAGRKALRDFTPAAGVDGIPKSSLDAGRESVLKGELLQHGCVELGIKPKEQLDCISLLKRIAKLKKFVSTARVAIDPFIRRIERDAKDELAKMTVIAEHFNVSDVMQRFVGYDHYQAFPFDTELFYGVPSSELSLLPAERVRCRDFVCQVEKARRRLEIIEPTPYFAVLVGDGDHMGALISGLYKSEEHQQLSHQLCLFAKEADTIISRYNGSLVYSGGDDVLAFLPLDKALCCANELRITFEKDMSEFTVNNSKGEVEKPTFSCGISIGHFSDHLQHLLKWGRMAERAAKDAGRNSLAVHLHTRTASEECVAAVHSWKNEPVNCRWERWVILLNDDILPDGVAYELRELAREFRGLDNVAGMLPQETERILKRKKGGHGKEALSDKKYEHIIEELKTAIGTTVTDLDSFVNEILIARQIARAVAQADEKGGAQ